MNKIGQCRNCECSFKYATGSSVGFYCSNKCSAEHRFKTKTLPRILEGKVTERRTLHRYLVRRDGDRCSECEITDWQGKGIRFEVDHKNGDPSNNKPENLRLLCPNCHSQTPFFCARNRGRGRKARGLPIN